MASLNCWLLFQQPAHQNISDSSCLLQSSSSKLLHLLPYRKTMAKGGRCPKQNNDHIVETWFILQRIALNYDFAAACAHNFLHIVARSFRIAASAFSRADRFPLPVGDQLALHFSKITWAILSTGSVDWLHFRTSCSSKPSFAARRVHSDWLPI